MVKLILNSILLLSLLFQVASATNFNILTNNNGFKTSTELRGYYKQMSQSQDVGYHKAEVYFKTKVPSLNPDQAGVSNIDCSDDKITLSLNDEGPMKDINNWPDKVMLLVSHKWQCFNKTTTQFFMVGNKTSNIPNKSVTFNTEKCDISEWTEKFLIDVSWENEKRKRRSTIDKRYKSPRYPELYKRISIPSVEKSAKLNLNALFDENTKASSKPNLPLLKNVLFCANCFTNGEATVSLKLGGDINLKDGLKLTDASVSLNGNFKMNIDLSANGTFGGDALSSDFELLSIPIPGVSLTVPGVFQIGPSIDLVASTKISTNATAFADFGADVNLPNFSASVTFVDEPKAEQSGFQPTSNLHKPNVKGDLGLSIGISASLKPRLALGLSAIFNIKQKLGFQIVGTLDNILSIGNNTGCKKKTQPRFNTTLNGNVGFFIQDKDISVANFPSLPLFDKCL